MAKRIPYTGPKVMNNPFDKRVSMENRMRLINQMALTGTFTFTIDFVVETSAVEPAGAPRPSLSGALQEQLGLKLESRKAQVEMLVVDHIERPSEN